MMPAQLMKIARASRLPMFDCIRMARCGLDPFDIALKAVAPTIALMLPIMPPPVDRSPAAPVPPVMEDAP